MGFAEADWNLLFPKYLNDADKGRLKVALEQFRPEHRGKAISYDNFYSAYDFPHFLQGDIVGEMRLSIWNKTDRQYEKRYVDAIIISNSCDISFENTRNANIKECLFAPIISLSDYAGNLTAKGYTAEKLNQLLAEIRSQFVTNIFYLPPRQGKEAEHIVFLDQLFWFPTEELSTLLPDIKEERLASLNQYGFYLFILKLSYHLCRLPEEADRPYSETVD